MNDYHDQTVNQTNTLQIGEELNMMLSKLDLEDSNCSISLVIQEELNPNGESLQNMPKLFKEEHQIENQMLKSSSQFDIEAFKEKIRVIIGGQSTPPNKKSGDQQNINNQQAHFSTLLKKQNNCKSRQVSIHTNAFLGTDIGDDISQKQEIYSTAQTVIQGSTPHQREGSNKLSFFEQDNTTFISYEYNPNEQLRKNGSNSENSFNIDKFQQLLQMQQTQLEQQKKKVQRRLVTHEQDLKLRKNLKRKMKCVVNDPAEVPMSIYYNIITYDGRLFKKFTQLSRGMRKHQLFHVFDTFEPVCQSFLKKYGQVFQISQKWLNLNPISFCQEEGSRLDMVLKVQIKKEAKKLENRSIKFGYSYNLENQQEEYQGQYQFDLFKSQSRRWLWLHKDECMFHGMADARSYTIPIMPICVGDEFEISVQLLSLMGSLQFQTVKWGHLMIENLPEQNDVRNYNRVKNLTPQRDLFQKYFADLQRVCEVEDTIIEWFKEKYVREVSLKSHIRRKLDINQFSEQFDVIDIEVGGIDFSVWKVYLRAKRNIQTKYKYYNDLNIGVKIVNEGEIICNEVKRKGFLIDRGAHIELRPKDEVIVYVSMGGFEK